MKVKVLLAIFVAGILVTACGRPECKTKAGKKKRKYYNSVQYK